LANRRVRDVTRLGSEWFRGLLSPYVIVVTIFRLSYVLVLSYTSWCSLGPQQFCKICSPVNLFSFEVTLSCCLILHLFLLEQRNQNVDYRKQAIFSCQKKRNGLWKLEGNISSREISQVLLLSLLVKSKFYCEPHSFLDMDAG
jgi:hypothetical protein